MNILLLGKPASGKGTQTEYLLQYYHLEHISTGNMIRELSKKDKEIERRLRSGILFDDFEMYELVKQKLLFLIQKGDKGYLLDGFPRTIVQAELLDKLIKEHLKLSLDYIIEIDITDEVSIKRQSGRRVCDQCGRLYHIDFVPPKKEETCDDCNILLTIRVDLDKVKVRLNEYHKGTEPLLSYYGDKVIKINGNPAPKEVFKQIKKILNIIRTTKKLSCFRFFKD